MAYTPKHAAPRRSLRRNVGVGLVGAATATMGAGMIAPPAQAAEAGVWDRLAQCEAGGNWHINTGNGFYGGLQFTLSSWKAAGGTAYAARPDLASREGQIAAGQRLLALQGPGAWPVCSVKAGLTRGTGGANAAPKVSTAPKPKAAVAPAAQTAKPQQAVVKPAAPVVPAKPAAGKLQAAETRAVQNWVGVNSGSWNAESIASLQRKIGAEATGRTDVQTIAAVEKMLGMAPSGLDYFTQPMLDNLTAHAQSQLTEAGLKALVAAVEGGSLSPETLKLAASPTLYR